MKSVKELITLFFYLLGAVVLVYYVPAMLNRLAFLVFLVLFYRSKKNYFWIVFLYVILEQPGGLFSGGMRDDQLRLPLYSIMPGFSFAFEQLFVLTALVKALKMKARFNPVSFLRKDLHRLGVYFIWLLVVTITLGVSFDPMKYLYWTMVNLTLFYSLFFLIREEKDFISFFRLIFPFAFIAFFLQLQSLVLGHQLIAFYKPDVLNTAGIVGNYDIQRPIEMSSLLMLAFFGSLYFIVASKKQFDKYYLLLVNIVSYFAIIITASRGWVIAFSAGYILMIILIPGRATKIILKYSIIIGISIFLLFSIALFKNQYHSAMKRIGTIGLLAEGDITAGGTLSRYDKRGPRVIKGFKESTILFGSGFGDHYWSYFDGHLGYHSFLLNAGIVGSLFLALFFYKVLRYPFILNRLLSSNNPYKNSIKVFPIAIISILILNSSVKVVGYDAGFKSLLNLIIILYFLSNNILNALAHQQKAALPKTN